MLGGAHIDAADETDFTFGLDYEYRLNKLLGVGAVVEHVVADIHLWRGLALQVGPGIEIADEGEETETFAIGRIGTLYEVEFGEGFTFSPQVHYDVSSGPDALVFAVALGFAF